MAVPRIGPAPCSPHRKAHKIRGLVSNQTLREYGSSTRVCELFELPFRRLVYRPDKTEIGFSVVDAYSPEADAATAIRDVNPGFEMIHPSSDFRRTVRNREIIPFNERERSS
jgi:hypothetical protein